MEEELLTPSECAQRKGVTQQAISAAIQRGEIPVIKVGRNNAIRASDCEAYQPKSPKERGAKGATRRWDKESPA